VATLSDNFSIETADGIATLTFRREERLNALDRQTFAELAAAAESLERDSAVQVVVMTGAGKAFVAGADINEYLDISITDYVNFQRLGRLAYDRWERLAKPVIAAVNGYALGGGFEFVLIADIVIASERARFGLPECKLGLLPGGGGTQRLTRLVGRNKAKELLMTGDFIDAPEAHRLGIVNRVVPPEKLMETARELAMTIIGRAPLAVQMAKQLVNDGLDASLATAITQEMGMTATLYGTEDAREGIAAFMDKRPAMFRGR
jgi:enoyl-CoA hydratase/carnithine racemase